MRLGRRWVWAAWEEAQGPGADRPALVGGSHPAQRLQGHLESQ